MELASWFAGAVLLAVNGHALIALVAGMRSRDVASMRRHARRCALSAAGFALLSLLLFTASVLTSGGPRGGSAADRARFLARVIAETLNTAAFTVLSVLLPLLVAATLYMRARRATR